MISYPSLLTNIQSGFLEKEGLSPLAVCRADFLAPSKACRSHGVSLPLPKPLHYHISSRGKQKGLTLIMCMQTAVQHKEAIFFSF